MRRKQIATFFILAGLVIWILLFVLNIAHMAPCFYDKDSMIGDGFTEEDIMHSQVSAITIWVFIFPPIFVVGLFFLWSIYNLIKGNRAKWSAVCRIISASISFSIIFFAIRIDLLRIIFCVPDGGVGMLMIAAWIVIVLDSILAFISQKPNH